MKTLYTLAAALLVVFMSSCDPDDPSSPPPTDDPRLDMIAGDNRKVWLFRGNFYSIIDTLSHDTIFYYREEPPYSPNTEHLFDIFTRDGKWTQEYWDLANGISPDTINPSYMDWTFVNEGKGLFFTDTSGNTLRSEIWKLTPDTLLVKYDFMLGAFYVPYP
jgi:hypothetical protein